MPVVSIHTRGEKPREQTGAPQAPRFALRGNTLMDYVEIDENPRFR
jgi:hypothetical protein